MYFAGAVLQGTHLPTAEDRKAISRSVACAVYPERMSEYGPLSRETEIEAIEIIGSHLGRAGAISDTGMQKQYDFDIAYQDGRTAIGEIGLLEDEDYRKSWNSLTSQKEHHIVHLPEGYGVWSVRVAKTANGKHFRAEIGNFIKELIQADSTEIVISQTWPRTPLSEYGRSLGILHLHKIDYVKEDFVFYTIEHSSDFSIPDSLNPLVEKVQILLHEGACQDSWQKLLPYEADEKHVYLKCGSLISFNLQEHLLLRRDPPSIPDFLFPDGITHFWLRSIFLESRTILWINGGQKTFIP